MSKEARQNLAPPESEGGDKAKRKMTAAIIEEDKQKKETFEFLEEDDDFEEFEDNGDRMEIDMNEDVDKKLW